MSGITTHVLDVSAGRPAAGVTVVLERLDPGSHEWQQIGSSTTDDDGRARDLGTDVSHQVQGEHRLTFGTGEYFQARGEQTFYPSVTIAFTVDQSDEHYHVPLLVSPFGFTTYRGS